MRLVQQAPPVFMSMPLTLFPILRLCLSLAVLVGVVTWSSAAPVEVWVASDGQRGAKGTINAPLGSVTEAVRHLRNLRRTRPAVFRELC